MEYSFLIDVNLPKHFSFFNHENFYFVSDINNKLTDSEIWNYAFEKNMVIVTKDVDFYNRLLVSESTPKVIYIQLGNYSLKQLYNYFELNWTKIISEISTSKLIIAKETHIECIL